MYGMAGCGRPQSGEIAVKIWRVLLVVLTFGPCPHDWARIASACTPQVTVKNDAAQCPKRGCCRHSAEKPDKPADCPSEQKCSCRQLAFITSPAAQVPELESGFAFRQTRDEGTIRNVSGIVERDPLPLLLDGRPGGLTPLLI